MNSKKRNNNIYRNKFKVFFLILYVVLGILRTSTIEIVNFDSKCKYIQIFSLCVLLFLICVDYFRKKIKIDKFVLFLGIYSVINVIITKHTFFLGFFIFYLTFVTLNYKKTVYKLNVAIIITSLFIMFLSFSGFILNDTTTRGTSNLRYFLGFKTSTLPCTILLFTLLNFIAIFGYKLKWYIYFIYVLFGIFLYKLTDTRTGFLLVLVTSTIFLLMKNKKHYLKITRFLKSKSVKKFVFLMPLFIFLFEVLLVKIYYLENDLSFFLNRLLSTRLSNTKYLIDNYSFSFFGNNLPTTLENGFYIGCDICYLYYLLNFGIFSLLITFYLQYKLIKGAYKCKNYYFILLIIIVLIDGIVEPYLLDYKYQFITFALSSSLLVKNY